MGEIGWLFDLIAICFAVLAWSYRSDWKKEQAKCVALEKEKAKHAVELLEIGAQKALLEAELYQLKKQVTPPPEPKPRTIRAGTASDVRKIFEKELAKEETNV